MKLDALGLGSLFVATLLAFSEALAAGTDDEFEAMPDLVVLGTRPSGPGALVTSNAEVLRAPAADGGDLLRGVNGVSASRMGGRGLDPVIRGQSQGRVNILVNGAYIFGACPNRMDPPSSFAAIQTLDQVVVLKGVQTLLYGGGGSGGTVIFQRHAWPESDGGIATLGAATTSNGTHQLLFGDLGLSSDSRYLRARFQSTDAGNYSDGDGDSVRSAYEERGAALETGTSLTGSDRLEMAAEWTRGEDIRYAGAGMDAPKDDSDSYRLKYQSNLLGADLRVEGWYSKVRHLMDNYSLRALSGPMAMRVPARTTTAGGRVLLELPTGEGWKTTLGVDYLDTGRHATRFAGPDAGQVGIINAYLWPGADISNTGLVAEASGTLGIGRLALGIRHDHVDAGTGQADKPTGSPMPRSADELYAAYYGRPSDDRTENNLSAMIRYDRPLWRDGPVFYAGLSRTMRTADATERFIAADSPMDPVMRWVGDPGLDPEQHRQVDLGLTWRGDDWDVIGALYYDDVRDYIAPDRAREQPGILRSDGARVYRNVSAALYGAELEGRIDLSDRWRIEASAAYVHAENTDDNRPLPQIPPLNGRLQITHSAGGWDAGARLRWADRQSRADDDPTTGSGVDARETPGYGVLDVFARFFGPRIGELGIGADNLLDKTWADHLNRSNQDPFNPDPVQVNEPGRTLWINWKRDF
jgi:iron complex outermembrane receptor protein